MSVRTIFSCLAVMCLAIYFVPGVMASSGLDEADEATSSSLWPFDDDFLAHVDSDDSDVESDSMSDSSDSSDSSGSEGSGDSGSSDDSGSGSWWSRRKSDSSD